MVFSGRRSSAQKALTCQDARGRRDPKETSRGQKQGPHIDTDLIWVAGSEAAVQSHLRDTKAMSPSQGEPTSLPQPQQGQCPHLTHWLPDPEGGRAAWNQSDVEGLAHLGSCQLSQACAGGKLGVCVESRDPYGCRPRVPGTARAVTGVSVGSWESTEL